MNFNIKQEVVDGIVSFECLEAYLDCRNIVVKEIRKKMFRVILFITDRFFFIANLFMYV